MLNETLSNQTKKQKFMTPLRGTEGDVTAPQPSSNHMEKPQTAAAIYSKNSREKENARGRTDHSIAMDF
jgi:hypothetical protein